jgi:amino-acid N-acetyltransferase
MVIDDATPNDLPAVHALLTRHHLPLDDVTRHVATMVVAREADRIVGVAALELYAGGALLRSVAVDPAAQGQRVGHQLTEAALNLARARGIDAVFLLTTSADGFFSKFGFEPVSRVDVPESVQASVEFQSACPVSAVVMRKRIPRDA